MEHKQRESLVVTSKIKDYIKSKDMMSAGELPDALSDALYDIIDKAIHRCQENKRKTVSGCDV